MNTTTADAGSATVNGQPEARQLRRSGEGKMLAGLAGGIPVSWPSAAGAILGA
jgi:hypothetical protein